MRATPFFVGIFASLAISSGAQARDQISIVGSSTVYPFSTIAAEKFGQSSGFKTPVVESTGTGGGMKLFCKGIGVQYPDVTNASRAIKSKEAKMCADAGVAFQEFIVGNDGIAFANSLKGQHFKISIAHVAAALAAALPFQADGISDATPNQLQTWADVDAYTAKRIGGELTGLPNIPVSIMVPPPTSGTRDAMGALFMKNGWKKLGLRVVATKNSVKTVPPLKLVKMTHSSLKSLSLTRICLVSLAIHSLIKTVTKCRHLYLMVWFWTLKMSPHTNIRQPARCFSM